MSWALLAFFWLRLGAKHVELSLKTKRMTMIPRHGTALNAGLSGFVSFPWSPMRDDRGV